eukprot:GHRQ01030783.1.p1 GENE.GHRQ01030783.1~~GHRQ01030783.1.p1  ORF type:complete len:126 (+),score=9.86 GHRQ01030783.1:107-484(+)
MPPTASPPVNHGHFVRSSSVPASPVLGAPAQHVDQPPHLVMTANDGVQLALSCQAGQVARVLGQHSCKGYTGQYTRKYTGQYCVWELDSLGMLLVANFLASTPAQGSRHEAVQYCSSLGGQLDNL